MNNRRHTKTGRVYIQSREIWMASAKTSYLARNWGRFWDKSNITEHWKHELFIRLSQMGVAEKKWGRALHVDSWKCFDYLQNSQTNWATDNHIASFIVSKGINKKHLQKLAANFQYLCLLWDWVKCLLDGKRK